MTNDTNRVKPKTGYVQGGHQSNDRYRFLRAWFNAPRRIGTPIPSSRYLAAAIAAQVDPAVPGRVVQLGAGTGAVTQALIERGVAPSRLILFESNQELFEVLCMKYPDATVLRSNAFRVPNYMNKMKVGPLAAVVSGLPLTTQSKSRRQQFMVDCICLLSKGAPFIQVTYLYHSRIKLPRRTLIKAKVSSVIWRNLWPARVWSYRFITDHSSLIE